MYCKNCGAQLNNQDKYCAQCGVTNQPQPMMQNQMTNTESGHWLWGLLGFFLPIAGLILFIIWKDSKPKAAKSAGIGALISVVLGVLLILFGFFLLFIIINSSSCYRFY